MRILVVEDDPRVGDILEHQLRRDGHDVRRARTGLDAGFLLRDHRPHLVFLDLMLPGVNGEEICRNLRADPDLRGTKVIGMSASSDEHAVAKFRAIVDHFVPKPFKLAEISKLVGPDPRGRVVLWSADEAWAREAERALGEAGYAVERCATPEAAGHAIGRARPLAAAVHGIPEPLRESLRKLVPIIDGEPASLAAKVPPPPAPPKAPSKVLPTLVAAAGLLAIGIAWVLWPRGTPAKPDPEIEDWRRQEERMAGSGLVFYRNTWISRSRLGEGTRVQTVDRDLEGFLAQARDGFVLSTADGTVKLRAEEILRRERKRLPYEEYWDRAPKTAEDHYQLGLWCRAQGLPEAAVREFRRALIADPAHAAARSALGR